jgi:hypothetical protein
MVPPRLRRQPHAATGSGLRAFRLVDALFAVIENALLD